MISWAAFIVALAACGLTLTLLIRFAKRMGLVDHPAGRKDHPHPVPVVGGIGILLGIACGFWLNEPVSPQSLALLAAGGLLIGIGVIDDLRDVHWMPRIVAQMCASVLLMIFGGVMLMRLGNSGAAVDLQLGSIAIPFTIFAVVGLINAVNMVDGLDGLAGSLTLSSLLMMAVFAHFSGNAPLQSDITVCVAAVSGFLLFNLRLPGRSGALTFLGNGGSALLGLMLAWAAVRLSHEGASPMTPALAPWLVAVPILDCLSLIARRLRSGRSPFAADRTHLHHLLLDRGMSVNQVILACLGLHFALAATGVGLVLSGTPDWAIIVGFIAVLVSYVQLTFVLAPGRGIRPAVDDAPATERGSGLW